MSVLVLTGYDETYADFGALMEANFRVYAKLHGYEYACWRRRPVTLSGHWLKVEAILSLIGQHDAIAWFDIDSQITDLGRPLPFDLMPDSCDLLLGRDHTGPCTGLMLMRCTDRLRHMWRLVYEHGDVQNYYGWHDQYALHQVLRAFDVGMVSPAKPVLVSMPNTWQRGDFTIHWPSSWKDQLRDLLGLSPPSEAGKVLVV